MFFVFVASVFISIGITFNVFVLYSQQVLQCGHVFGKFLGVYIQEFFVINTRLVLGYEFLNKRGTSILLRN